MPGEALTVPHADGTPSRKSRVLVVPVDCAVKNSVCTGAVASSAATVEEIIAELEEVRLSERTTRVIDHDQDGSMERKKREGYF